MKQITLLILFTLFSLNLSFTQVPPPPGITPVYFCDDGAFDGVYTFDLDYILAEYLTSDPNLEISIHQTALDALNNVNPMTGVYTNTLNPEYLYLRVYDITLDTTYPPGQLELNVFDCTLDMDGDSLVSSIEDIDSDLDLGDHDTDANGIPNFMDDDDDGDGVLSIDEDYNNNGNLLDDDINNNMIPDYLDSDATLSNDSFSIRNVGLHPNPVKDQLNIVFTSVLSESLEVRIYNILGNLILRKNVLFSQTNITIDASNFDSGVYLLAIKNNRQSITKKFIKE